MTSSTPVNDPTTRIKRIESESAKSQDGNEKGDDHRLWIGNLDPKLTEFQLLKIIQKFGPIDNFDFLFHRTGPNSGLPRGYAFVTFSNSDGADTCLQKLNGRKIFDRTVSVRWAQQTQFGHNDDDEKLRQKLPALGMNAVTEPKQSKERTISAIEAKLKAMEREKDQNSNFSLGNKSGSTSSSMPHNFVQNYPYASSKPAYHPRDSYRARSRPYSSNRGRKRF